MGKAHKRIWLVVITLSYLRQKPLGMFVHWHPRARDACAANTDTLIYVLYVFIIIDPYVANTGIYDMGRIRGR